jgi:lipooligosaccharide transport system permease protein
MTTPGPVRVIEWNAAMFRRLWRTNLLNSFLQPMLYLLGLGVGVGSLVNRNTESTDLLGGLTYVQFVAPGLVCTAALAVAYAESAWPVLGGFKWQRQYVAMSATPLRPSDIVAGHGLWLGIRLAMATSAVVAAMMLFPSIRSAGLLASIVFATLSGLAFGMAALAFASFMERDMAFVSINRFVVIPLFLFGGAFFPIAQLPGWLQALIKLSPLWHGIELSRSAMGDGLTGTQFAVHVGYLALWIVAGTVVAARQFRRRLGS